MQRLCALLSFRDISSTDPCGLPLHKRFVIDKRSALDVPLLVGEKRHEPGQRVLTCDWSPWYVSCSLEDLPNLVQLSLNALQLEEVPEDQLVCAH